MKHALLAMTLSVAATGAWADAALTGDQMYMGAGRWTCAQLLEADQSENRFDKAQAVGWVLGFWSAATVYEDDVFTDLVEQAGGETIYGLTLRICQDNPQGYVGAAAKAMLSNTKAQAAR